MPYATQRDRVPPILELEKTSWPAPPLNLFLRGGFQTGVFDLQWDDPAQLSLNSSFQLLGVNVYRSFDSEYGPFERLTSLPVGSTFWRDQTDNVLVADEDVSNRFILRGPGQDAAEFIPRYVFRTIRCPIVIPGSQALPTSNPADVMVFVDGVRATVLRVDGNTGEIELDPADYANVSTQKRDLAVLPGQGSKVTVSYRYNRSLLKQELAQRTFYRVTTVGIPSGCDPSQLDSLVETPLEQAAATNSYEVEKLDWIWREAIRRNRWILSQGGERVKFFLVRNNGVPCPCIQNPQYKQPLNDCTICFGVGFVGGYDGPYDGIIAPDDAEKRVAQQATGRVWEHTYEVWTGPTPLLHQRDFLVKVNGERYSVGPVRIPSNRGMLLQQHFNISAFDAKDIRNSVLLDNPARFAANQLGPLRPDDPVPGTISPAAQITDKPNIPDERELRGRTITWENIVYGILLLLLPWSDGVSRLLQGLW